MFMVKHILSGLVRDLPRCHMWTLGRETKSILEWNLHHVPHTSKSGARNWENRSKLIGSWLARIKYFALPSHFKIKCSTSSYRPSFIFKTLYFMKYIFNHLTASPDYIEFLNYFLAHRLSAFEHLNY